MGDNINVDIVMVELTWWVITLMWILLW